MGGGDIYGTFIGSVGPHHGQDGFCEPIYIYIRRSLKAFCCGLHIWLQPEATTVSDSQLSGLNKPIHHQHLPFTCGSYIHSQDECLSHSLMLKAHFHRLSYENFAEELSLKSSWGYGIPPFPFANVGVPENWGSEAGKLVTEFRGSPPPLYLFLFLSFFPITSTVVTEINTKLIHWEFSPLMFRSKITKLIIREFSSGSSLQDFAQRISVRVSSDQWAARWFR